MGLDYVDLYLIHFPISLKFVPFETRSGIDTAEADQVACAALPCRTLPSVPISQGDE